MMKFEGDHRHIFVNGTQDYSMNLGNGVTGIKYTVGLSYDTDRTIQEAQRLLPELQIMVAEWRKYQHAIETSPAVKASWESFLTMVSLAKDLENNNQNGSST